MYQSYMCYLIYHGRRNRVQGGGAIPPPRYFANPKYYHSIFLSYMTYCIVVWGKTFISNLSSLNSIHKKVVRLISNCKYNSSSVIFRKLRVLKFLDIVNFKTAEIVFKAVRNQ